MFSRVVQTKMPSFPGAKSTEGRLDDYSQVDGNQLSITFSSDQRSCAITESSLIAVKSLDAV